LVDLLDDAVLELALPRNFHEAKKVLKSMGVGYTTIHTCENDCILFWKEHKNSNSYPKCKASHWKSNNKSLDGKHEYKVPRKVLRYCPIKKRVQRLFVLSKTACLTRWHDEHRRKDDLLRHPTDYPLWTDFDEKHPKFADDSRNIRLAFATDGFNPYRTKNVIYSIWPDILIPLNFPPSMCNKDSNFIMSVLIPNRSSPDVDMDVYFQPLVHDLLDMFLNVVRTYDASKGEYFQLHAAILWTITSFLGLGSVSGFVISGEAACPDCHSLICSLTHGNGSKSCYMGHRRFLHGDHPFRFGTNSFDVQTEFRLALAPLSEENFGTYQKSKNSLWQGSIWQANKESKTQGRGAISLFEKKAYLVLTSILEGLEVRYNFDAMHIEKNVCDNIINTLLDISGKSKDNLDARMMSVAWPYNRVTC
jgi:hypothetical protein